jgi:chromosome segregation ATPase
MLKLILSETIKAYNEALQEKDTEIQGLKSEIQVKDTEIQGLKSEIQVKDAKLEARDERHKRFVLELNQKDERINELMSERDELEIILRDSEYEIRKLREDIKKLDPEQYLASVSLLENQNNALKSNIDKQNEELKFLRAMLAYVKINIELNGRVQAMELDKFIEWDKEHKKKV